MNRRFLMAYYWEDKVFFLPKKESSVSHHKELFETFLLFILISNSRKVVSALFALPVLFQVSEGKFLCCFFEITITHLLVSSHL